MKAKKPTPDTAESLEYVKAWARDLARGRQTRSTADSGRLQGYRQQGGNQIGEYVEVETCKSENRPELLKAIAHAKRSKARLVVAKLDRMAGNVAFTSALMESGIDFVACDNPHANNSRFTFWRQ